MADYSITPAGKLSITVDLNQGFAESSASGKTMPAMDAAGLGRKVVFGTFKGRQIAGSLQVYVPLSEGGSDRKVVKL